MIEVNNLTTSELDENFVKRITEKVLKGEKKPAQSKTLGRARQNTEFLAGKKMNLSVAFIGEGRMRKLNKKYRKKNRVTDVLAFQELGEMVICLREVKKSAEKYKVSFEKELARVLIHGILHLLGYNHEKSEKEGKEMREKEEYYLQKI